MTATTRRYEWRLVATLTLAYGLALFEQNSIAYLMPFIKAELQLSNTQVGLLVSAFTVAYAISTYAAGVLVDSLGRRKLFLMITILLVSLCSILSGLATSFATLIGFRFLMGLLEGPVVPIAQSMIALETPIERRGVYSGVVTSLGSNVLGQLIAPLLLVSVAAAYNWRAGFFVVLLPGLLCVLLIKRSVNEPVIRQAPNEIASEMTGVAAPAAINHFAEMLRCRNVWLCALMFTFFVAYAFLGWAFVPLYLVNQRLLSSQQMGVLMSVLGVSGVIFGVALPSLSDHIGRKPVLILGCLLGLLFPLAALYFDGTTVMLALLFFIGWAFAGIGALVVATIPSEAVPHRSISTAIGLVIAVGFLLGGLLGPTIGGWSADRWGLHIPLLLQAGCCLAILIAALFLHESAPKIISKHVVSPVAV